VQKQSKEIFLPVERIDWADAERNYVDVYAAGEVYTVRTTLEQLVRQLDHDQFVRINRSQIVNLDRVKEMQPWFHGERLIVLKDGRKLMWTRRYRAGKAASSLRQARPSR
jgi:two-component system LytT family response regulator